MIRRLAEILLDRLAELVFGHLDDVEFDAEWDLHDAEQDLIAGCVRLCQEAA